MDGATKRESVTPTKLLRLFEDNCYKRGEINLKNTEVAFSPPSLLPGEDVVLHRTNVTCVATLPYIAKGDLFLTNYRILFSGAPNQSSFENFNDSEKAEMFQLGFKYQKKRYQMPKVHRGFHKIQKFVGESMKKKGRALQSSFKRKSQHILFNRYDLEVEDNFVSDLPVNSVDLLRMRLGTRLNLKQNDDDESLNGSSPNVVISLPILSISEIRKYPKQYLEREKLKLLRDGIEVLCNNLLSVKFCIGDSDLNDVEELVSELEKNCNQESILSAFVYTYSSNLRIPQSCHGILEDRKAPNFYKFSDEIERLQLNEIHYLSIVAQSVCSRYPENVVVSSSVRNGKELRTIAEYHANRCFPVATWRNRKSGCVLFRSGMPKTPRGLSDSRCEIDEKFLHELCPLTSNQNAKVIVFTERVGNISTSIPNGQSGLSVAEGQVYYYPHCSFIVYDYFSELKSIQQSGSKLMNALSCKMDEGKYFSAVEDSGWLQQIGMLLEISSAVAASIENEKCSVVVAFGFGTDRTAQIVSLAQLLLDPYFRTIDGFQVLIQKEWLAFRHNFVVRNISSFSNESDLSPIFLQFLDCVWQLCQQFPTSFQFSNNLLEELAVHSYSGRFGTFLDLNDYDQEGVVSLWTWLNVVCMAQDDMINANYDENENTGLLNPVPSIPWLKIWKWHYRFQMQESLSLAADIASVQLENLQRTYKDKLEDYRCLLQKLSVVDAGCASRHKFHIRSSGSSSFEGSGSMKSGQNDLLMERRKKKNGLSRFFAKKSKSLDNLSIVGGKNDSKTGRSIFYDSDLEHEKESHEMLSTFPRSARLVSRRCNLRTELNDKGIRFIGVNEVQVTQKTCSGYLVKQGKVRKSWKRRWFVLDLRKGCVAYFEDHLSDQPKGVFKCLNVTNVRKDENQEKYPNLFIIETTDRNFSVEAPNSFALDVWLGCFQAIWM